MSRQRVAVHSVRKNLFFFPFNKNMVLIRILKNGLYVIDLPLHKSTAVSPPSQPSALGFCTSSSVSSSKKCYIYVRNKSTTFSSVHTVVHATAIRKCFYSCRVQKQMLDDASGATSNLICKETMVAFEVKKHIAYC
ncbi:hypothetical protein ACOSP7_023231 [Xanthoceras sorbifolium]